jgi:predicted dehydrogenase
MRMRVARAHSRHARKEAADATTVKIGLVGLGYWGQSLLRVLADLPDVEVSWMCDLDTDRLGKFACRYPAIYPTTRFEDLLRDETIDAVVIATPIFTHHALAMRALSAGKHVCVEKPLAPSVVQADELLSLAASRGLALMCNHTVLYSAPVREVERLLVGGEIGKVSLISASRVSLGLHQHDVSVIWDLGPHDFSILLHWLGELPESVRTIGRTPFVEGVVDVAFIALKFPSGIGVNLALSWLAPSKLRRTVIVGSEKIVVYDDGAPEPVRLYDRSVVHKAPEAFGEYRLSYPTGDILSPKVETCEPLEAQMRDFVAAVRDGRSVIEHTQLARDVVELTQAAEESLVEGRELLLGRRGFAPPGDIDGCILREVQA